MDKEFETLYPLCCAAGISGDKFKEEELENRVTRLCNRKLETHKAVAQIKILEKLKKNEPLTVDDVNTCLLMQDLPGEEWRRCVDWPHYFVSNLGRVKSSGEEQYDKIGRPYVIPARIMTGCVSTSNRIMVLFSKGKHVKKYCQVHRLVAKAFIPKTEEDIRMGRDVVNHMDANPHNNNVSNLEWTTILENTRHAINLGLCPKRIINHDLAAKMRNDYLNGIACIDIARKYNIPNTTTLSMLFRHNDKWPDLPVITEHFKKDTRSINNGCTKFTLDTMLELKVRLMHSERACELAKLFGVSQATISCIKHNKYHTEVTLDDYPDKVAEIERRLGYR